jgi:hypothetical protein
LCSYFHSVRLGTEYIIPYFVYQIEFSIVCIYLLH